jgi:hypothetical protein
MPCFDDLYRHALEELINKGLVYNTIDYVHFKLCWKVMAIITYLLGL